MRIMVEGCVNKPWYWYILMQFYFFYFLISYISKIIPYIKGVITLNISQNQLT